MSNDEQQKERERKKALEDARHQKEKNRIRDKRDKDIGEAETNLKVSLASLGLTCSLIATIIVMATAAGIA